MKLCANNLIKSNLLLDLLWFLERLRDVRQCEGNQSAVFRHHFEAHSNHCLIA